jgi:uncharacterized protein YjbI with pentapeptide repeats
MGKPRKNQPGYVKGVDSLGRRSWRKAAPTFDAPLKLSLTGLLSETRSVLGHDLPVVVAALLDTEPAFPGVNFSGRELSGFDLSRLDLRGCNFSNANLRGADLSGAFLGGANLEDADLTGAHLSGARISDAQASGANFADANCTYCVIDGLTAYRTVFDGADMKAAAITNSTLSDASMRGVHGDFALNNVILFRADLTGMKASGRWTDVSAQDADVSDASFNGVTFARVNMQDANLVKWQADQILGSHGTAYDMLDLTLRYTKMDFDAAREEIGLDDEEFSVLMWLGEIEVRSNHTGGVVTRDFDPDDHHVPAWGLRRGDGQPASERVEVG